MMISDEKVPMLIAQTGPAAGQRWALIKADVTIGREPDCDVVIPDRQVSRVHAAVHRVEGGFELEDLSSKNGTHLNGRPVQGRVRLQDGDLIQVALVARLAFVGSEATVPLQAGTPMADLIQSAASPTGSRLRLDSASRRVWIGEREVDPPLSAPQFRFLELLYEHPGQVCSRETIIETVWPEAQGAGVSEQAIDALVRRLRDRLAEIEPRTQFVATVRGHGFRLDNAAL
jgi:DNA-binding response OmpR family regulator